YEFYDVFLEYFNRSFSVGAQGASIIHGNNYLSLDEEYKDAYGNPMLKMTYDFTEQDRKLHKYLSDRSAVILEEMGADIVEKNVISDHYDIVPYQSTHNTGGVPMGDDPNISA